MTDWVGWGDESYAMQASILFWCAVCAIVGGGSVLLAYALFGIGPRRTPTKAKKRKKGRR